MWLLSLVRSLRRHGARVVVTLLPLGFAVLHALGVVPMEVLNRLDNHGNVRARRANAA